MNIMNQFSRSELILGKSATERLNRSRIAVFGVGGVGGYAVEALARAGVGAIDLYDDDKVSLTNINRQIFALHSSLGRLKVDVARERIIDINPCCKVTANALFYMPETTKLVDFKAFDYVIDAIDTVTAKISIIEQCSYLGVPVISAMGAGNKLDPTQFEVSDIFKTSVCPLARTMRQELKKLGIDRLKVVYSKEKPIQLDQEAAAICLEEGDSKAGKVPPGSVSFVPSVMGLIIAGEVIKDIINK